MRPGEEEMIGTSKERGRQRGVGMEEGQAERDKWTDQGEWLKEEKKREREREAGGVADRCARKEGDGEKRSTKRGLTERRERGTDAGMERDGGRQKGRDRV